jgi:WD40 repeat protein
MMGPARVDVWDLDGGPDLQFEIPYDPSSGGIAFLGDGEIYYDLSVAVVCDSVANRLVAWDYTETSPTYTDYTTLEFPNIMEADYEGHRLFVYCRASGNPAIEVWDVETWSKAATFQTNLGLWPFMTDIDFDPHMEKLYFGSGDDGQFEVWNTDDYSCAQVIDTGYGAVAGIDHMGCGVYVTVPGHLLVYEYIDNQLEIIHDVACGSDPRIVACNPNNHKIYVPDMTTSSVFVFQG